MERERRSREYWEQELSEYWDSGLMVQEYSELKESKPIFSSDGKSFRNIIVDIKCNILSVVA